MDKIRSVIALARYCIGDILYCVTFQAIGNNQIETPPGEEWMYDVHPKIFFERGLMKKTWKFRGGFPKLGGVDFAYVTQMLTSELVVKRFEIVDITRSFDTGEFYYCDLDGDWMPESCVFQTHGAAKRERNRINRLFQTWLQRKTPD